MRDGVISLATALRSLVLALGMAAAIPVHSVRAAEPVAQRVSISAEAGKSAARPSIGAVKNPAAETQQRRGWSAYKGGYDSIQYSGLAQINRDNVKNLQVAWKLDVGGAFAGSEMQCNPIVIDGVIYLTSPTINVIAADAATGQEIWRFDPHDGRRPLGHYRNRGLSYWSDGMQRRIFVGAGNFLYALDARTGKLAAGFGQQGRVDLREGLDRDPNTQTVQLSTPGVVYRDLLIIGSNTPEILPAAYGDIRAFDVRTGKIRWVFHTIPRPGEFGYDTWPKDAWQHVGSANSWGGLSLDEARGIVYVPTGSAAFDYYGGNRAGDNLFANTLLALDAKTGARRWHFQTVHHDIWDRDLPTAPSLITVSREGKQIDAVAQPTKGGHVFVFDRDSGAPLFPIEERPVITAGVPGETLSRTQPFPLKPRPFGRQVFTEDMVTDRTPAAREAVLSRFRAMKSGGQFIPMSEEGTILLPGIDGGAEWGGAAWDPETGLLYVNANDVPWYVRIGERPPRARASSGRDVYTRECAACHGGDRRGTGEFPSIVDIGKHYSDWEVIGFVARGSGRMPGFSHLSWEEIHAVASYVTSGKDQAVSAGSARSQSPYALRYMLGEIQKFQDPEGYPGIKPPWGTLSAIDMNTGEYAWQIPLGEYPELAAKGLKETGTENYGGLVVTAGGLVFIGATIFDKKFRAFDKRTGELLWETSLPASAHATPAVYEVNGRQFVTIAAGGGKDKRPGNNYGESGASVYVAFALPGKGD